MWLSLVFNNVMYTRFPFFNFHSVSVSDFISPSPNKKQIAKQKQTSKQKLFNYNILLQHFASKYITKQKKSILINKIRKV